MNRVRQASNRRRRGRIAPAVVLGVALLATACERRPADQPPDALTLSPASFEGLPGWQDDPLSEALPALLRSCRRLQAIPDDRAVGPNGVGGTVADWRAPCAALEALPSGDDVAARAALEAHFTPFAASADGDEAGLFTGYYEAELRGSFDLDERYRWPLYHRPPDLVTVDLGRFRADLEGVRVVGRVEDGELRPYPTRAEIDAGALSDRTLELLWVDDPVDVFFLHVQGSGRVVLPDGSVVRVGFAASNGHPFYAIGRALIEEGRLPPDRVSMQAIRDWLRRHPEQARAVMQRNARYIFFRPIVGGGPVGAQGVALTAGRSLAVDPDYVALGAPVWLDTTWPGSDAPLRRLMVAQDTGSAIKGPVRGDVYWGSGEEALEQAGRMKQAGRYYLLLPKSVAERRRATS